MSPLPILYTSFDEVPGPKGASTHIEAFVRRLGQTFGQVTLITPGPQDQRRDDWAPGVQQLVIGCPDDNPIGRCRTFRARLAQRLRQQPFRVIHFRSIFEGLPLLDPHVRQAARILYEVNGFPSVELKYHYPRLLDAPQTMAKLIDQEEACLAASDAIVTVSQVNQRFVLDRLARRNLPLPPVHVIPNGVDAELFAYRPPCCGWESGPLELLYFGTPAPWQGLELLLRATARLQRVRPCRLTVAGPVSARRQRRLHRLSAKLQLQPTVHWAGTCSQQQLAQLLHACHATVVPLLPVDRNLQQGCCPLKLIEALAAGCPVVAADLPVVRELADPERHFVPFRPGDLHSLVHRILELCRRPEAAQRRAAAARKHVEQNFTWQTATDRLLVVYDQLLDNCATSVSSARRS